MNHPSDNPETCCPVCHGDGELSVEERSRVDAASNALALADRLAQKVMALRADQNSWPKEEEVYQAMVEYRAVRAQGAPSCCTDTRRNPSGFCEACGLAH